MDSRIGENQIYTGIDLRDLNLLEKYRSTKTLPEAGFYIDFMGVKTRLSYFGLDGSGIDEKIGEVPFPDDGVHAEAIEYLAALQAVETAGATFTAVELGAGYAPWLTFSAKAAQRSGISQIHLLAVEADLERHGLMKTHLADNGLYFPPVTSSPEQNVKIEVVHAAVSDSNGTLKFDSQSLLDWGAAPVEGDSDVDYRGYAINPSEVNSLTIERAINDLDIIDFLHIDIQGYEYRAVLSSLEALRDKVRIMLIATHSRKIEGDLLDTLHEKGWRLIYEKPCKFERAPKGNLTALTTLDGTQVWMNCKLEEKFKNLETIETVRLKRRREVEWLSGELATVRNLLSNERQKLNILQEDLSAALSRKEESTRELNDLYQSKSWKITEPLRWFSSFVSRH